MATNSITAMTATLYEQLDRLMAAEDSEQLKVEAERSRAMQGISDTILESNRLAFDMLKFRNRLSGDSTAEYATSKMLGSSDE